MIVDRSCDTALSALIHDQPKTEYTMPVSAHCLRHAGGNIKRFLMRMDIPACVRQMSPTRDSHGPGKVSQHCPHERPPQTREAVPTEIAKNARILLALPAHDLGKRWVPIVKIPTNRITDNGHCYGRKKRSGDTHRSISALSFEHTEKVLHRQYQGWLVP